MPKIPHAGSGHSPERVTRILTTGLTDEQLRMIGEIAILWNSAQARFEQFICLVAQWDDNIASMVTADMQSASLIHLARNIVAYRIRDIGVRTYAECVIELFDKVRIVRNKTVHGLPIIEGDKTEKLRHATAKGGTGTLKVSTVTVDTKELQNLISDIGTLSLAIEGSIFQFFTLQLIELGNFRYAKRGALNSALLIELDQVQTCLESLSLRYSTQGKRSPPPGSSRE